MPTPRRIGIALDYHLLYKHHTDTFAGLKRYADERQWRTVHDDWLIETLAPSPRGRPAYDGVVARVSADQVGLVDATAKAGIPLINVLADSPVRDTLPGVFPDFEQAGRMQADHLVSRGFHRLAFMATMASQPYRRQAAGFTASAEAEKCTVTLMDMGATWGDTLPLYRKNLARLRAWMDTWELPIGVAVGNDNFARVIAQMVLDRGWRVPEDVAIIGGLNEEKICETSRPTLSSLEYGFERVGYEAGRLLERLMEGADAGQGKKRQATLGRRTGAPPAGPSHIIVPPIGVVARESTDFYAADDSMVAAAHDFISKQCHTRIGVGDVAAKLCVSLRTLQNRFTGVLRRTVAEEIRRVRLEKAKRELTSSDRSVHEIARRSGFTCNTRMTEAFKRELGVTPLQYRKQRTILRIPD
jgi:LacI family transcriptional regulator